MSDSENTYRSYLLRLWREDPPGAPWRAMLENIAEPGQRRYFKDLDSLVAFILELGEDGQAEMEDGG